MPSSGTGTKDGWRRRLTPKPQRRRPEPPSHHERVAIPPQQAPELRQNCWQCCEALKCSHAGELLSQRQGQRCSLPQNWSAYAFRSGVGVDGVGCTGSWTTVTRGARFRAAGYCATGSSVVVVVVVVVVPAARGPRFRAAGFCTAGASSVIVPVSQVTDEVTVVDVANDETAEKGEDEVDEPDVTRGGDGRRRRRQGRR